MVGAISVAAKAASALSSADSLLGKSDTTQVPPGTRHWSFYVVCAGAAIGAVSAIATIILGNYLASAFAGTMALMCGFAAYQIRKFGFFSTLEGYVEHLAERVYSLKDSVQGLRESRLNLDTSTTAFGQAAEVYKREVAAQITQLEKQIREVTARNAEIKSHDEELKVVIASHQITIKQLSSEKEIMTRSLEQLTKERTALADLVENLGVTNTRLGAVAEKARLAGLKLDEENDELRAHNAETATLILKLQEATAACRSTDHVDASASRLGGTTQGLKKAAEQLESSTQHVEDVAARLEKFLASDRITALAEAARMAKAHAGIAEPSAPM